MPSPPAEPTAYSENDLDEIIKAVGSLPPGPVRHGDLCSTVVNIDEKAPPVDRRAELRLMLDEIAYLQRQLAHIENVWKFGCSSKAVHSQFQGLLRAVSDFECAVAAATPYILPGTGGRSYIRIHSDSPAPPEPDWLSLRQVLAQARAWAEWNCRTLSPREASGHGGSRARPPNHLCVIVSYLGTVYQYIFERAPGVSTVEKEVGGPFVRFLDACLRPLLGDKTPSCKALRRIWQRRRATMSAGVEVSDAESPATMTKSTSEKS